MERIKIEPAERIHSYRLSSLVPKLKPEQFGTHEVSYKAIKTVLRVLADHYPNVWPSVKTIAEKSGYGETQTKKALRALEGDGYIRDISGKKGGIHNSVQYVLDVQKIVNPTGCAEFGSDKPDTLEGKTRHSEQGNPTVSENEPDGMCRGTENTTEKDNREYEERIAARSPEPSRQSKVEFVIAELLQVAAAPPFISRWQKEQLAKMLNSSNWTKPELRYVVRDYVGGLNDFQCRRAAETLVSCLPVLMASYRERIQKETAMKEQIALQTERSRKEALAEIERIEEPEIEEHL